MIEWTHSWKKFKVNLTENAWNNLGQLSWTLPAFFILLAVATICYTPVQTMGTERKSEAQ